MSTRKSAASFAPSSFSACAAARTASRYAPSAGFLAQADQQHALGGDARQAAKQQRRAGPAGDVAQRFFQRAFRGLIDAARGRRELATLVNAEHHAADLRRLGRQRLYAKFHGPKVSHPDLPPGAAERVRRSRGRRVHDAVRHRGDHAAHPPARPGRGRQVPVGRGVRVPRLLRARRAAGAAVAHHVHLGAAHHDAQLARLRDGDLVRRRACRSPPG